jgi:hypothetical protein
MAFIRLAVTRAFILLLDICEPADSALLLFSPTAADPWSVPWRIALSMLVVLEGPIEDALSSWNVTAAM